MLPQDDPTITPEQYLWRRIPPWHFTWDANDSNVRPTSSAFENDDDGGPMSVQLADVLTEHGLDENDVLCRHSGFAIARFTAETARDSNQRIVRDPRPPDDPAHALVIGDKPKKVRRKLALASQWQTVPPALPLGEGFLLVSLPEGVPWIRYPDSRIVQVEPDSPPLQAWVEVAIRWLALPESQSAPLRPTVERAVLLWTGRPVGT